MKRRHTRSELRDYLGVVGEPEQLVAPCAGRHRALTAAARAAEESYVIWSAARAEANIAYDEWCAAPGAERYLVYRAAEDRADAAEVALARLGGLAAA